MKHRRSWSILVVVAMSAAAEGVRAGLNANAGQLASHLHAQNGPGVRQPPRKGSAFTVVSPSKSLDVYVEAPAVMKVRVVLTNHSTRALLAVDFSAFRGSQRVISDRRRSPRNEPLILAGAEYTLDLPAPLDRFVVISVLWDDGRVEGDPGLLADERVLDIGKATEIRRVMKLLRAYRDLSDRQTLDDLRGRLVSLSVTPDVPSSTGAQLGMQQVREAVLQDLMAFERAQPSPNAGAWRTWLDQTIGAYEEWFARIAAR